MKDKNITINVTLLRDGFTWRATAEATQAGTHVYESGSLTSAVAVALKRLREACQ